MTTKVVKGSLWTLGGSVLPLAVSFVSTPFIIRFLGAESYGVLLLVGLIPTYFSFADFGMGIASTRFASESYGQGDSRKESEIVWTATAIALITSLVITIPTIVLSFEIVVALNVPDHLLAEASMALKIAALAFALGILGSVLNSPMLARLRMDLNTLTSAVPKVLLAVVTPFILYYGGGLVAVVSWALIVSAGALVGILWLSRRLLPELLPPTFSPAHVLPLLTFGGGLVLGGLAGILLVNFEKLALSRMISVTSLAYYSVAYTLANIAMLFSMSMTQSLLPAFSQLLLPEKRNHLNALFATTIRLTIIVLLPTTTILLVVAKPFFTHWAGEEFGKHSTLPFYILLLGVAFNMLAFIQHSLIISTGRTGLLAKIYWVEFILYVFTSVALIHSLGIVGAALAWTIRVVADAVVFIFLGERLIGVSFRFREQVRGAIIPLLVLAPVPLVVAHREFGVVVVTVTSVCMFLYAVLTWKKYVREADKTWLKQRIARFRAQGAS